VHVRLEVTVLESRDCPAVLTVAPSRDPFPGYGGPVERAASGDTEVFTADKIPHVVVYVGGVQTASFYAYDPRFDLGINVAVDPDNGDVATGTDGGAPHVQIFDQHGNRKESFFSGDPNGTHGAFVSYATETNQSLAVRPAARQQLYLDGADTAVTALVAAAFSRYDIGVTNRYPAGKRPQDVYVVFVIGDQAVGPNGERGATLVNGFNTQSEFATNAAKVYAAGLGTTATARSITHEAGHGFGLGHSNSFGSPMLSMISDNPFEFTEFEHAILQTRLRRV
jgi:hypothetical protein